MLKLMLSFFMVSAQLSCISNSKTLEQEHYKLPYIFISLGCDCKVATFIRSTGLNSYAYPFDWMFTLSCDAIIELIEKDFENFLTAESLTNYGSLCRITGHNHIGLGHLLIWDLAREIGFMHDFNANQSIGMQLPLIKEKYRRRIQRLFRVLNQKEKKVYLVRKQITKTQALKLRNLLNTKFPNLNYTIIALDNSNEIRDSWNFDHVKNYYFDNPSFYWNDKTQRYIHTPLIRTDLWLKVLSDLSIHAEIQKIPIYHDCFDFYETDEDITYSKIHANDVSQMTLA